MKKPSNSRSLEPKSTHQQTVLAPSQKYPEKKSSDLLASLGQTFSREFVAPVLPSRVRTLRYIGSVNRVQNERILARMEKLVDQNECEAIGLFVTSPGGATGSAMSFYDTVRHVLKPNLVTIGSGEVDSSGFIVFLSGTHRYISARTTGLLHSCGRVFGNQRYTTAEMAAMLAEDTLKDQQYATVLADRSNGRLSVQDVLLMMQRNTVLSAEDFVRFGLAESVID
jgi:ATP-dependent protease ClpP protease subunit